MKRSGQRAVASALFAKGVSRETVEAVTAEYDGGDPGRALELARSRAARMGDLEPAKAFYEFVTSRESMLQQANDFYRIPARTDIPLQSLPAWIRARAWKAMDVDWKNVQAHEQQWMRYWDEKVKGSGRAAGQAG